QLLVLVERLDELAVRFAQLVLEDHELLGRLLHLLAQATRFRLERPDVRLEILDLDFVLGESAPIVGVRHGQELGEALHPLGCGIPARIALLLELLHVDPFLSLGEPPGVWDAPRSFTLRGRPQYRCPFPSKSSELPPARDSELSKFIQLFRSKLSPSTYCSHQQERRVSVAGSVVGERSHPRVTQV